jgi:hypothetical protein
MAVTIPIISEFDGKGISKAIAEFKQLEGAGAKAKFALQKAAIPAAAALAGVAVAIGDATKAAIQDAKAQQLLAKAIEKNTLEGKANVKVAEQYIEKTMMSAAVADDELRPALSTLVQTTGDLTYSQKLLNMALDISAATGTDLGAATDALAKAYTGNTKALGNMVPAVRGLITDGASLDEIMQALSATVGGAATVAAESAEGRMKRLSLTIGETKEAIGAAFLPILEQLLPKLQKLAEWVQQNSDLVVKLLIAFGSLATAVLVANTAMKIYTATTAAVRIANGLLTASNGVTGASFATMASRMGLVGTAATTVGLTIGLLADNGGEAFKKLLARVIDFAQIGADVLEWFANSAVAAVNYINKAFNFLLPGDPFSTLAPLDLGKFNLYPFGNPNETKPARGGLAGPPSHLAELGMQFPIIPGVTPPPPPPTPPGGGAAPRLPRAGMGGGDFSTGGFDSSYSGDLFSMEALAARGQVFNITVNAAVAEASLGDKIVEALTDYNRRSGPIDIAVA